MPRNNGATDWNVEVMGSNAQVDGATTSPIQNMGFNGTTWDRWRNNTQGTLLASATRTVGVNSPNQTNYNAKGVYLIIDITQASGTGGLNVYFGAVDPVSGKTALLNADAPILTVGTYIMELYPGSSASATGNVKQRISAVLPRTWYARVGHVDSSSYTYSLGYALIL